MKVGSVMSQPFVSVSPQDTIRKAATLMQRHDIGVLPVISDDHAVGMLTDRDIVIRIVTEDAITGDPPVGRAMSPDPFACYADQDVTEAAALMGDEQIRRLLVLDARQRPVGIISVGDIAEHVSEELAGQALGEICEDR